MSLPCHRSRSVICTFCFPTGVLHATFPSRDHLSSRQKLPDAELCRELFVSGTLFTAKRLEVSCNRFRCFLLPSPILILTAEFECKTGYMSLSLEIRRSSKLYEKIACILRGKPHPLTPPIDTGSRYLPGLQSSRKNI